MPVETAGGARRTTSYCFVPLPAEATRGKTKEICVIVNNTAEAGTTLTGLAASVSGPVQQYVQVMPLNVSSVPYNHSGCFKMVFMIPVGIKETVFNVSYAVSGNIAKQDGSALSFLENRSILLYVYEFGRDEASMMLAGINGQINTMFTAGLPTAKLLPHFTEAANALAEGKYADVKLYCEELTKQIDEVYAVKALLAEVESKMDAAQAANLDTAEMEAPYKQAKAAFENEEFGIAKEQLENALLIYAKKTTEGFNIFAFATNYWWLLTTLAAALFVAFYLARNTARMEKIRQKITSAKP